MTAKTANPEEITRMLLNISEGSSEEFDRLLPVVYESLKHIARSNLRQLGKNKTLCTTELVHEAYIKMLPAMERKNSVEWKGRTHFYAIASRAMRQILVDYARRQQAAKRADPEGRITLTGHHLAYDIKLTEILTLDRAMESLAKVNDRLRKVVEYRFFGGMKDEEIADTLNISTRTVERDWVKARLFLHKVVYPND